VAKQPQRTTFLSSKEDQKCEKLWTLPLEPVLRLRRQIRNRPTNGRNEVGGLRIICLKLDARRTAQVLIVGLKL
jgi:hypothetical protein